MDALDGGGREVRVRSERSRIAEVPAAAADDAARWRTFCDSGVAAVAIYDPDGTLRQTNERMSQMWNVSEEQSRQLIGRYNLFADPQQAEAGIDGHIRRAFAGEQVDFPITRYVVDPGGGGGPFVKWVRGSFCPVLDADGRLQEVVLTLLDVTDIESAREDVEEQRQQAEQQLREIEHLYDTSPIGLCFMDTDLRFVRINDKMAEINGRSKAEHLHKTVREVMPELADVIEPLYREVIETGRPMLHREIPGITAADPARKRSWMVSYHPLWDAEGRVEGVGTVVQDITSLKDAQKALLESEERFREMAAHLRDIFWSIDSDAFRATYVSPAFEDIYGRRCEELYADMGVWVDAIHEEDRPAVDRAIRQIRKTGEDERLEYRILRPDGSVRWLSDRAYAIRDETGRVVRLAGISQDITERKKALDALRESEEQLRTVIGHAPAVIWALDQEGNFTLSEGRGLEALGLRPGEVVGQNIFDVYSDHQQILDTARRCLAGQTLQMITPVGDLVFDTNYVPRFDSDGQVNGAFGVAIDVTDRERSREERIALERKVLETQRLESLGVLAGGIAHDFNNLLMGVLGSADLAASEIPKGTPGRRYLKQIETTAVRAAELTNQMLAYSGQGRFIVEPTSLNQIVTEMSGLLQTCISKKAVLELDLEDELPAVEADASQMRQVVMNLITNASEALNDEPGTIVVRTSRRTVTRGELEACTFGADLVPGACVSLRVTDDGAGMDADTRRRIFDPFFTTKFTGRGLGLAGVLGIVRGHKGAVRVESTPGSGSAFEILLPAAAVEVAVAAPAARPVRMDTGSLRVLVADDDEMVLQVASLMLETAGFEVLVASDGQEAVDVFREEQDGIDLVLLDMTMPRLSGEEAFEEIRTLRPDVPVILSSGYTEQEARGRLESAGVAGFVQKPYRAVDLLGAVQNVMQLATRPDLKP